MEKNNYEVIAEVDFNKVNYKTFKSLNDDDFKTIKQNDDKNTYFKTMFYGFSKSDMTKLYAKLFYLYIEEKQIKAKYSFKIRKFTKWISKRFSGENEEEKGVLDYTLMNIKQISESKKTNLWIRKIVENVKITMEGYENLNFYFDQFNNKFLSRGEYENVIRWID
ncbi:MAG: hypothetical protein UR43_C0020G0001 [candidate division TM6 bacterium GW2011_GWF2_33_332]|nr:MAG: hypothetical protein UR43_C0020G0001 [candidate division TM6 bacterium GW2011_GWF2_33_332]